MRKRLPKLNVRLKKRLLLRPRKELNRKPWRLSLRQPKRHQKLSANVLRSRQSSTQDLKSRRKRQRKKDYALSSKLLSMLS